MLTTIKPTIFASCLLFGLNQAQVPEECFNQREQVIGNSDMGSTFSHKEELMSNQFNENMRLSEIKCCLNSDQRVSGLAIKLTDEQNAENTLDLEPFGKVDTGACDTFSMTASDNYIKSIEISSDLRGINTISIVSTDSYLIF